ncbi:MULTISPECIES: OmpA family protein [unclassified Francisella]|uniref:OmpA family protein n=1 Tax=unclassified Francisella TaxID=2610885 RepID=UPI002E368091|nr:MULTISPECIES: OmpA family protein [unclassified Francisella]MED7820053.1 OmpA family protein [Francisella sp. 19S2-4]MED7830887.1 OmpA family protein [Francisella sp. 19S2-10]
MKLRNIVMATSVLLGTATMSFAANSDNVDTPANATTATTSSSLESNSFITPFANTYSSLTNENNTWGPQDRTGQWYLGVGASGLAGTANAPSGAAANFTLGYNLNKYFAVQYYQLVGRDFAGLGEGVINFSNSTMFTPYMVGGAGWGNIAGKATGAWDVGGGLKFELSRDVQASVDYRYIQTMAPTNISGPNGQAGTNVIGAGLTWFFGGKANSNNDTANIQDNGAKTAAETAAAMPTIDESKYVLPQGIKQCEGNFNLTKDGVACYTVNGSDVTVYLDTKFAYDSTNLNQRGKDAIASFVKFIKGSDIASVTIKGYASQGQTGQEFELYNQKLSEKRAQAVSSYMKQLGLDSSKIITKGFGYTSTIDGISKSDARNQRVEASVSAPLKQDQ